MNDIYCDNVIFTYKPHKATIAQKQEYAQCIFQIYPLKTPQKEGYSLDISFGFSVVFVILLGVLYGLLCCTKRKMPKV